MYSRLFGNPLKELEFILFEDETPNYGETKNYFDARVALMRRIASTANQTQALLLIDGNNHICGNQHKNPGNWISERSCPTSSGNWHCGNQDMALVAPFCEFTLWHLLHDYKGTDKEIHEQEVIKIIADIRRYAQLKNKFDSYISHIYSHEKLPAKIEGIFNYHVLGFREPSQVSSEEEIHYWASMVQKIIFGPMIAQLIATVKNKINALGKWEECTFDRNPISEESKAKLRERMRKKQFSTHIFGALTLV